MSKTIIAIIAVSVLLMSGGAFALSDAASSSGSSLNVKTLDGFTLTYSNTTGFIGNVSYMSENGNVNLTGAIYINGSAQTMTGMMSNSAFSFDNGKVMVFGSKEPKAIALVTYGSTTSKANMTVNLNEKAQKVSYGFKIKSSEDSNLGGLSMSTFLGLHLNEYVIENGSFRGFFITDGVVQMNNNGYRLVIDQNTSTMTYSYMPLVSVFVTSGNLNNLIQKYEKDRFSEKFTYNASTGNVSGRDVQFNFNATTGILSDLKLKRDGTMHEVFASMMVTGNGTIGQGMNIPSFQLNSVQTFGSLFLYANNSYIVSVHDNPVAQGTLVVNNGTATIVAPAGANVTYFKTNNVNLKINASLVSSNSDIQEKAVLGFDHEFHSGTAAVRIETSNVTELLMIDGGNLSVKGQTITLKTNGTALIHFLSPPGFSNLGKYKVAINDAIQKGKIAAQLVINGSTNFGNFTVGFNSSVQSNVSEITHGKAVLTFSATRGNHTGTDVMIFLSKQFLNGSTNVYLKFDGQIVSVTSMNNILNITSSTNASFAVYTETSGDVVILHIPHFSNHTVEISTTPYTSPTSPASPAQPLNDGLIITIGAAIVAVVVIAGVAFYIRRK